MPGGGIRPRGPSARAAAHWLCPPFPIPPPHHCPSLDDCSSPPGPPAPHLQSALSTAPPQDATARVPLGSNSLQHSPALVLSWTSQAALHPPALHVPSGPVHRLIRHAGSSPSTCLAVSTAWATPSSHSPGPLAGSVAQHPRPIQRFLWTGPGDPGTEEQTPGSCSQDLPAQGVLTLASQEVRCG